MSAEERKAFHTKALEEQRHLLKTALDAMAHGDLTQALNVATRIRVLIHETGSSKPLLKSLCKNYLELPIIAWTPTPAAPGPPGVQSITFYCPVSAELKAPEGTVSLNLEIDLPDYGMSQIGRWWEGPCMVLPGIGPVTRRELILGLSNKEGGAHVDDDISKKYKNLLASEFLSFGIQGTKPGPLNISRLSAGRLGLDLLDCLDKNFLNLS